MKKIKYYLMALLASATLFSCKDDDHSLEEILNMKGNTDAVTITVGIDFNDGSATITGDRNNVVTTNGAHVTVDLNRDTRNTYVLTLSGTTKDGSLKIYGQNELTLLLKNADITNPNGAAINNQCHKALYVVCEPNTSNVLTDGETYAETSSDEDEKGTLFSEGQMYFSGTGALTVNGKGKNAIACDDYIHIDELTLTTKTAATGSHGIKVNEELYIEGGTINIKVMADGAKGIKCDSTVTITGGNTTITTSGGPVTETIDDVTDVSSCAAIKCDYDFTMTAGTLTMTSSGEGGKGLNCDKDIYFKGGTLTATTTGKKDDASPKAVNADGIIYLSGGSFTARCESGRATDCASGNRFPDIQGTATIKAWEKKEVIVIFE